MIGRRGGICRPPRQPLSLETEATVRAVTQVLIDAGVS